MNKVAILGCGWLGFPLAEQLLKDHHHVNGSTTSSEKIAALTNSGIKSYKITLETSSTDLSEFLDVDHLIITIPPKTKNYAILVENLIHQIERSPIKHVIYTSSISVYGNAQGIISEENKTSPTRNSVAQILTVEKLLLKNKNFKTTILRLGGLIGGKRHPAYYVSGKQLKAPNELINLVHLDDCITAIQQLLNARTTNNIFNLVYPYHPTKASYYSYCCKTLNIPEPITKSNTYIALVKKVSSKKIMTVLNYEFKNNLILS